MERVYGYQCTSNIRATLPTIDTRHASGGKDTFVHRILKITGYFEDLPEIGVFRQSPENELKSLELRHLTPVVEMSDIMYQQIMQIATELSNAIKKNYEYKMYTEQRVLESKSGLDRKRYQRAFINLKNGFPLNDKVNGFIKMEKFTEDKLLTKPPRMIQFRSYEFLGMLTRILKPIDKMLLKCESNFNGQSVGSLFGKGESQSAIAAKMRKHWDDFSEPVALCVDATHFDNHVTKKWLQVEHSIYGDVICDKHKTRILKKQLKGRGVTQFGIKYELDGTRCSGEYNTGMGNSLISVTMITHVLRRMGIRKFRIIVNGDDSVIFIESRDLLVFKLLFKGYFSDLCMDMKLDRICYIFEQIEFCQCQPVYIGGEWRLIRNPKRLISRSTVMINDFSKSVERYYASLSLCELALNVGCPMLQSFALKLLSMSNGARPLAKAKVYKAKYEPDIELKSVSESSRESFYRAFGIDPIVQKLFEDSMGPSSDTTLKQITKYKHYHRY